MRSACWGDVDYPITQPFLPGPPAVHCGIDIGCPAGTVIYAARGGTVERVQAGLTSIRVNGQRDFYLHGYSSVGIGQWVKQGQPVIRSGMVAVDPRYPPTGPHLHFEVQDGGFSLPGAPPSFPGQPVDPSPILLGDMTPEEHALLAETRDKVNELWDLLRTGFHATSNPRWIFTELEAIKAAESAAAASHVHQVEASKTGPAV